MNHKGILCQMSIQTQILNVMVNVKKYDYININVIVNLSRFYIKQAFTSNLNLN